MVTFFLFVVGLAIGSFAGAVVWRLHRARKFGGKERSECDHCHHVLSAADLVPVLSWLWLRGKCRYCHKRLSAEHPVVELITGLLFAVSYLAWPTPLETTAQIASFIFWLVYLGGVVILFLYDLKWKLLPDKIVWPLIWLAVVEVLLVRLWLADGGIGVLGESLAGVLVLAGFFGLLYGVSKGRWIGFGDVKLGVFMGLVLGMPYSLLALLVSYYISAAVIAVLWPLGRVHRKSQVPFGPFLLAAFFVSYVWGRHIIDWWQSLIV